MVYARAGSHWDVPSSFAAENRSHGKYLVSLIICMSLFHLLHQIRLLQLKCLSAFCSFKQHFMHGITCNVPYRPAVTFLVLIFVWKEIIWTVCSGLDVLLLISEILKLRSMHSILPPSSFITSCNPIYQAGLWWKPHPWKDLAFLN